MKHKSYFMSMKFFDKHFSKINLHHVASRFFHYTDEKSTINLTDIESLIKSTDSTLTKGHACFITNYALCKDNRRKECKIYINKITGFFMCENCRRFGPWSTLQKFLHPKEKVLEEKLDILRKSLEILPEPHEDWIALKNFTEPIENISNDDYQNLIEYFNLQHISQEILSQMKVLYSKSLKTLYFPLTTFRNVIVGYKSLSKNPDLIKTVPETNTSGVIVYKQKNSKSDGTAVLVPSIEDLLSIASEKAASKIICLPYNLQNIPLQILPTLESYKKLILWFGNEESSWDCAKHFAKKLNESRCYFVRPTDMEPQPKIAASLGYNLQEIIKNAQPICNKSIISFGNLRKDVLSELQNKDQAQGIKWTRYPTLNKILKGHRRGEFTVLTGPTGCGKTTFMSEYSLDLAMQGVNTLWGSFEIRNTRLAKTMLQQMVGKPLEENIHLYDSFADSFEKLPIYFMTFHGQENIDVVMNTIEHATYVHDIAHVIIDNIQFMMGISDSDSNFTNRFWRQDKIISVFRSFATKFNCHVSLVIHPRKENNEVDLTTSSIFGGAKASQEADNVLIVQDKRLTSVKGKKYLQVAKNRYSGDLGVMVLDFDKSSLSYAPQKKQRLENSEKPNQASN